MGPKMSVGIDARNHFRKSEVIDLQKTAQGGGILVVIEITGQEIGMPLPG